MKQILILVVRQVQMVVDKILFEKQFERVAFFLLLKTEKGDTHGSKTNTSSSLSE